MAAVITEHEEEISEPLGAVNESLVHTRGNFVMMSNLMSSRDIERSRSSVTCPPSFTVSVEAKHGNQGRAWKNSIFLPIDRPSNTNERIARWNREADYYRSVA